jgi:hypothetical protein
VNALEADNRAKIYLAKTFPVSGLLIPAEGCTFAIHRNQYFYRPVN